MLRFEWDAGKRRNNIEKHGIDFEDAKGVFGDPLFLALQDTRFDYGEERFIGIGFAGGRLLTVAFAERGDTIRIITARKAGKTESDAYFTTPR